MIINVFPFFNEFDLLDIRLNVMAGAVDRFALCESSHTFTGQRKPMYFGEQKRFHDDVMYFPHVAQPASRTNAWANEDQQREATRKAFADAPDDALILLTDADEIIKPEAIRDGIELANEGEIVRFELLNHYYWLNCQSSEPWKQATLCRKDRLPDQLRLLRLNQNEGIVIPDAGWHWSYLGGVEAIRRKLKSFSHQEVNTPKYRDTAWIAERVSNGEDLFERDINYRFVELDEQYPEFLRTNKVSFIPLLGDNEIESIVMDYKAKQGEVAIEGEINEP